MNIGFGGSKATKTEKSQTDPWEPTQPLLMDVLSDLNTARTAGAPTMAGAVDDATAFVKSQGDTGAGLKTVGGMLMDTPDRTGEVAGAYDEFSRRMTPVADGTNLDLGNNGYLQQLLKQVGDDAQERVNAQFAAGGRSFSGMNNIEVGRGVTEATLPILVDQYNREQGRTDAAARDLFAGGTGAATTKTDMDASRAGLLTQGAQLEKEGIDANSQQQEILLNLAEMKDKLPYTQLGWLTELLYPAAALGQQSEGKATQKGSKWGFEAGLSDVGKVLTAFG